MIIVVDTCSSGLGIAAQSRSSIDRNIKIVEAFDFSSPSSLISHLMDMADEIILFAWRGVLNEIIFGASLVETRVFFEQKIVGVSIADHAGVDSKSVPILEFWSGYVDFIFTTNTELLVIYSKRFDKIVPVFLFQDLPNIDLIKTVPRLDFDLRPIDVIWIGNSKWGSRQGYVDHKGLRTLFLPAVEIVKRTLPDLTVRVIDSARRPMEHPKVLETLGNSKVLVQTSAHEGTGLPVLEALILGCGVVTTPVGISPTLGEKGFLMLSEFTAASIAERIVSSLNTRSKVFSVEDYIKAAPSEFELKKISHQIPMSESKIKGFRKLALLAKWRTRHFQNKISRAK